MFHLYQVEWDPPVLETLPYDVLGPEILRRNIYGPAHMLMDCVLPIRDIYDGKTYVLNERAEERVPLKRQCSSPSHQVISRGRGYPGPIAARSWWSTGYRSTCGTVIDWLAKLAS